MKLISSLYSRLEATVEKWKHKSQVLRHPLESAPTEREQVDWKKYLDNWVALYGGRLGGYGKTLDEALTMFREGPGGKEKAPLVWYVSKESLESDPNVIRMDSEIICYELNLKSDKS